MCWTERMDIFCEDNPWKSGVPGLGTTDNLGRSTHHFTDPSTHLALDLPATASLVRTINLISIQPTTIPPVIMPHLTPSKSFSVFFPFFPLCCPMVQNTATRTCQPACTMTTTTYANRAHPPWLVAYRRQGESTRWAN